MIPVVQTFWKAVSYLSSFLVPEKIESRASDVSGKIEVHYMNGMYVLDSLNVNYSFGGLHAIFRKAFSQFGIKKRSIKNALILGFGSGSVASILQEEYGKDADMVGVEKDEVVIELARQYFAIDKYRKLNLHCADAYDFVLTSSPALFDLIVVDVFVDLLVPEKFQDEKFVSALSKNLPENGILFYNFIARDAKTRDAGGKLYKLLSAHFGKTEWVRIFARSTENWVFVCGKK